MSILFFILVGVALWGVLYAVQEIVAKRREHQTMREERGDDYEAYLPYRRYRRERRSR
ncbi:MAG: hypothetical protein AAF809_15495 [Bacteroidota bacterium]